MVIEKGIHIEKKKSGGRTGKNKEYFISQDIYSSLEIGDSVLLENVNPKQILVRLNILNKKTMGESWADKYCWKKFSYRTCDNGFRIFRIN